MNSRSDFRVCIVEPKATGHYIDLYVRGIVLEAMKRKWSVTLLTSDDAKAHCSCRQLCIDARDTLEVASLGPMPSPRGSGSLSLLRHQWHLYNLVASASQKTQMQSVPQLFYLNTVDHFEKVLAIRGSPFRGVPFAGLLMSVRFHHRRMGVRDPGSRNDALLELLFRRLIANQDLRSLAVIDLPLFEYLKRAGTSGADKVHFVPDAIRIGRRGSAQVARSRFGIAPESFVILVYGALSKRKGIFELIQALDHPDCPERVAVLVAGEPDEEVRQLLRRELACSLIERARVVTKLEYFIDDRELYYAADCVWVGYRDFYGYSGVLGRAASLELPVIGSNQGLIEWTVRNFGLGITTDVGDPGLVARAIRSMVTNHSLRQEFSRNARRFSDNYDGSQFGCRIANMIEFACGQSLVPSR